MKVLVISAAMGSNREKKIAEQEAHDVDFVFYNDSNFPTRASSFTPRMNAKIFKMMAWMLHPGYDLYIWMDNYFNISRPDTAKWFVDNLGENDALFFKHPNRSSIISEAMFMVERVKKGDDYLEGRINGEPVLEQAKRYRNEDWFEDDFLIAASSFCYRGNKAMQSAMEDWYLQTCLFSVRDQISLPYILKKHGINFTLILENVFEIKYLK